ncbi:hypothetical protein JCM8097_006549 [Rhodosporidiobolus ruineniae]
MLADARAAAGLPLLLVALVVALFLPRTVEAYVPAVPTNDTSALDSSDDTLHLAFTAGVYNAKISRQLWQEAFDDNGDYTNVSAVVPWTKYNKGVLLHFNETLRNQPPASVPWIAMISCDTNGTSFSDTDDIFTIVRDLGAEASLLYSTTSQGCQMNQEYLDGFEKVLDVFATTSLQAARIIEQQFINVNAAAYSYNSETLNNSASVIDTLLNSNALSVNGNVPVNSSSSAADGSGPTSTSSAAATLESTGSDLPFNPDDNNDFGSATLTPSATMPSLFSDSAAPTRLARRQAQASSTSSTSESSLAGSATRSSVAPSSTSRSSTNYLGAVMAASNLTVGGLLTASPSASASGTGSGEGGGKSQSLAMLILYVLTGVVTFLFLVVILSGAIRAIRHPERYGPRAVPGGANGGGGGAGQTRAGGLTRAILDTFPVVRFGQSAEEEERRRAQADEEAAAGGDGQVGTPKKEPDVEEMELAVLPSSAVAAAPALARAETDEQEELADASSGAVAGGRRRSTSRSSIAGESFHSAQTSSALAHQASVASLPPAVDATIPPPPTLPYQASTSSSSSSSPLSRSPAPSLSPARSPLTPDSSDPSATASSSALPAPVPAAGLDATLASAGAAGAEDDEEAESCPICFCEFEAGDELRVLPCNARHQFHTACIDPWLLEVSSSCPLCRLDLAAAHPAPDPSSSSSATSPPDQDAQARHEEERVIRHLRALLHRGTGAISAAGEAIGGGGGAAPAPGAASSGRGRAASGAGAGAGGEGGEGQGTARLRGKFARYVQRMRRERADADAAAAGGRAGGSGVGRRRRSTTVEAEGVPA